MVIVERERELSLLFFVEALSKISITWLGRTNVTDRRQRQTDRQTDDDI